MAHEVEAARVALGLWPRVPKCGGRGVGDLWRLGLRRLRQPRQRFGVL